MHGGSWNRFAGSYAAWISISSTNDSRPFSVAEQLGDGYVDAEIETSAGNGRLFAWLAEHAEITGRDYNDSRVTLHCRLPRNQMWKLRGDDITVRMPSEGGRVAPLEVAPVEME